MYTKKQTIFICKQYEIGNLIQTNKTINQSINQLNENGSKSIEYTSLSHLSNKTFLSITKYEYK